MVTTTPAISVKISNIPPPEESMAESIERDPGSDDDRNEPTEEEAQSEATGLKKLLCCTHGSDKVNHTPLPKLLRDENLNKIENENMKIDLEAIEEHNDSEITIEDVSEDFKEETCHTQSEEVCENETFKNCTSIAMRRKRFNAKKLICGLNIQMCYTIKKRGGNMTIDITLDTKDDFMCINLDTNYYETRDAVLNDINHKNNFEFQ